LNTGWVLTRPSTTVEAGDPNSLSGGIGVWCNDYANDRISINKGNADYIFSLGEPTNVRFETAFTASRTMTIPDKNSFRQDDHLFQPLEEDGLDKFCYEPDDEDDLVMCCLACLKYLKKGNRPPHAFKFPPIDEDVRELAL
jgi:hypothetical protein